MSASVSSIQTRLEIFRDRSAAFENLVKMETQGSLHVAIDEVSVLFKDRPALLHWVMQAVKIPGVKIFNAAEDTVKTTPIVSEYNVEYVFLEVEDYPFRIEAMNVAGGYSPLHDAVIWDYDDPVEVHYSFKCFSLEDYRHTISLLDGFEFSMAMSCLSSYGLFSYWVPSGENEHFDIPENVFLKPRVNTRDVFVPGGVQ